MRGGNWRDMKDGAALIGIIMGSDTDLPVMSEAGKTLDKFGVAFEMEVISAHRAPGRTHEYASSALSRGLKAIKVGAVNAAIFALQILGVSDSAIAEKLVLHKKELAASVAEKNSRLQAELGK